MTQGRQGSAGNAVPSSLWIDVAVIFGAALVITLLSVGLDIDLRIARAIQELGSPLGNRAEAAASLSFVLAALALIFLAIPPLRRGSPLATRSAAVLAATLFVAVLGVIMSVKNEINRPRPDQIVEFGGENEYRSPFASDPKCDCKAFPSSAAGFAFVIAAPFFVLRRRMPALAWGLLAVGLAWGFLVGYWRMVAGRHWATDIVWSAAIVLLVASLLSHLSLRWRSDA
jgi:membrane-associated PAP2 superfamily phosphatase